jgi:hypothetical protein
MSRIAATLLVLSIALLPQVAVADDAADVKTIMTKPGRLVFAEALDQPLGKDWKVAKGEWKVADGAMQVRELKAVMHGGAARRALPLANFIAQYDVKIDGAKMTTLSVNCAKGHCCRVLLSPTSLTVQKDSHDRNRTDKSAVLDRQSIQVAPGWHTLTIEIHGPEILASLDGKTVAYGSHPSVADVKANIGLTVAGESVSFKNLQVWETQPNSDWEANKAKLLKARTPSNTSGG